MSMPPMGTGGMTGDPKAILGRAKGDAALRRLAEKIQQPTADRGTPFAKTRIGFVSTVDYSTWTCSAYFSDLTTAVPNIPIVDEVNAAPDTQGVFTQVGNEFTLIGMLSRGAGVTRKIKSATQTVTSSGSLVLDNELLFYGLADRQYIFEVVLMASEGAGGTGAPDIRVGLNMPAGATTRFGGPGADPALTGTSFVGGGNWGVQSGISNVVNSYTVYSSTTPTIIAIRGTVTMGGTSGLVTVVWSPTSVVTKPLNVVDGSYLRAEIV